MIKWFRDIKEGDCEYVGSKGYNLGILKKEGFNVPDGFVITTKGIENWNEKAMELVLNQYRKLEEKRVAIRSSAVNEDLEGMSFAGQYETILNITTEEGLLQAIEKVLDSFDSIRAASYKKQNKLDTSYPAIVIQQMIESEVSGVMFTSDPMTGIRNNLVINSSFGLGEAIVSGLVTPDQYIIDKSTGEILSKEVARKDRGYFYSLEGVEVKNIDKLKQEEQSLTPELIEELLSLGKKVETYYKKPQDIEFAIRDNKVYLLQSRPITTLYPMGDIETDQKLRLYVNFNQVMQGVKEPFTPMGCELWKKVFLGYVTVIAGNKAYKEANYVRFAGGRVFVDYSYVLAKKRMWRMVANTIKEKDLPFEDVLNYIKEKYQHTFLSQRATIPYVKIVSYFLKHIRLYKTVKRNPEKAYEVCEKLGSDWCLNVKERLDKAACMDDLIKCTHEIGQELLEIPLKQALCAFSIKELPKLHKLIDKYYNGKMDIEPVKWALPHNKTTQMGLSLNTLAQKLDGKEFDKNNLEIKKFLSEYGHRAQTEIDIGMKRWNEDPQYIIELIKLYQKNKSYLKNIKNIEQQRKAAEIKVREIIDTFRKDHGNKVARKVEKILTNYRNTAGLRERPKFDMVRVIELLRREWLKQGEILSGKGFLENPEDIFYLYLDELKGNSEKWISIVKKNKEKYYFELSRNRVPRVILNTGETFYTVRSVSNNSTHLKGLSVSPGVYEGIVRVMKNPDDKINEGEIIVTESTNPAWTPLFISAGALIMESGGPISHGAIVAREYAIPGVVGIPDVTTILRSGMKVCVHGDTGIVEIYSQEKE